MNMRKLTLAFSAICLLLTFNSTVVDAHASSPSPVYVGTNVAKLAEQAPIHWVSVAQIEDSLLGLPPMAVGFDIDDTVLFSSPGFWRGKKTFSPDSEDYLKVPAFWDKMNNGWDEFSIPKEVARALIAMHVKRGDSIYFGTGRSQTKTESVTKTLQDDFLIPAANMNPVIFAGDKAGQNTKTEWLQAKSIKVFYGDSDNDITAARDAGARGIRVLRASNSTYKPLPNAGAFGEEVIVNSEY
jgi:acid phosphatase (class B)